MVVKTHRARVEAEEEPSPHLNSAATSFDISSTSRKGLLLLDENKDSSGEQGSPRGILPRLRIPRLSSHGGLGSPTARFRQFAEGRDEISRSVPSPTVRGFRERFNGILARKVDWSSLWDITRTWIKDPFNMALLLWIVCVAVSGAILFLVMTGMLNGVIPRKSKRDAWFEVNNQILNALFTLMCLYQHPKRFHHLVLLFRWKPEDIVALRNVYCKNATYKPNEWAHTMVVVVLLHVNCFAQYALCGLNLGYKRSVRPAAGVGICLSVAIATPAIAGVYSIVSPLGKDYESEVDVEAQDRRVLSDHVDRSTRRLSLEKRFSFAARNDHMIVELAPEWRGGLFDIWDDITTAYLSLFCGFCLFGWNMERLGFGNMYVHIATFLLFCTAPFWILNLAAVNIDNEVVREVLGLTGVVLCLFGLLYGGFWRIHMRKRFNLPANNACFGKPAIADCAQWLCCCWCSLAQEVRTADFYDVVEDKFCRKQADAGSLFVLPPLPREDGASSLRSNLHTPAWISPRLSKPGTGFSPRTSRFSEDNPRPGGQKPLNVKEHPREDPDNSTRPPFFDRMQREEATATATL